MLPGRPLAPRFAKIVCPFVLACAACSAEPDHTEPTCLKAPVDGNCSPALYGLHNGVIQPTFDDVFNNTLKPICAAVGCHSGANPQGGLKLDDIDTAYADLLMKNAQGQDRVIPRDLQCGKVLVRLETPGEPWSMPPGPEGHLSAAALCSIQHWIADGAQR